jgi:hypothetical protein
MVKIQKKTKQDIVKKQLVIKMWMTEIVFLAISSQIHLILKFYQNISKFNKTVIYNIIDDDITQPPPKKRVMLEDVTIPDKKAESI